MSARSISDSRGHVRRACESNREKDHGIVKGDARGAPASNFEGKIDARKKKHEHTHKAESNGRMRIAFERKRVYIISISCVSIKS